MKKNMKAYVLIDTILILTALLASMIEYAIAMAVDFHYPAWAIYPAAMRGATIQEAYAYCINQPVWWAVVTGSIAVILWMVPQFVYPMLCELTGREK